MATKLVLVDDDSTLLRFLSDFLRTDGFTVYTAPNGNEGLRLIFREHPDLVVLDVMMPGMDGWEVTARLRELADIPIILLTAKSTEADKLRGFKLGIDDYVTKPFSFAELSARIQAVITRSRQKPPTDHQVILVGDLTINLTHHEVQKAGQNITLTPTEFRLLESLARRQGQAVSEADLVQDVWGTFRQEETAVVRRYIFLLRQKIEPDPTEPQIILTVRGFGYRLNINYKPPTE
jgi:DNA-binding response OmpR family regulator